MRAARLYDSRYRRVLLATRDAMPHVDYFFDDTPLLACLY